uniref:Ig-like domain-containing protein n=1 Tax=Oncorhynchus tshawytscha TaxID=74940 RepID=A0A8C8BZK2_ONCTS
GISLVIKCVLVLGLGSIHIMLRNEVGSVSCCRHRSYDYMYWYRHLQGEGPKLMGSLIGESASYEAEFKSGFRVWRTENSEGLSSVRQWSLTVQMVQGKDQAVYLCAASPHGDLKHCANYEAHFGSGTKLTVLEPDIPVTPPTVKVLPPSTKECEDRNKKKKKTLVCVATDFYPDHVTVFWKLNGGANITDGVGTDNTALRDENRRYSITSRLRVPAKTWNTASNRFTCTVRFFNGTDDIYVADHIDGEEGMLAYSFFIAKSTFYGLVVMALIWKFQVSSLLL